MDKHNNSASGIQLTRAREDAPSCQAAFELPAIFCWSRIGAEAGQPLEVILRRKEWERQLNGGHFAWGIGNAVVGQMDVLARRPTVPKVVFSRMRSAAQKIDSHAGRVLLWTAFRYGQNVYELPKDVLVTSRATTSSGVEKTRHYVLFCFSEAVLGPTEHGFNLEDLENLSTANAVGFSQVTAVVKCRQQSTPKLNRTYDYSVDAIADLVFPFCAALEYPTELSAEQFSDVNECASQGNLDSWKSLVRGLREQAGLKLESAQRSSAQTSLF